MKKKYSIVIPCYNEEKGLNALIDALSSFDHSYNVEFILVENGSTDNSREIFQSRPEIDGKRIKKVFVNINQGYGYGIKKGLMAVTGDYAGWLHADLQVPLEDLLPFFDYADQFTGNNLFMRGLRKGRPFVDRFFTKCMGIYETLLFDMYMYDVMAMPTIFSKSMLDRIDEFPDDFSIDIYVYAYAKKHKYDIYRHEIHLKEREFGASSWNTGLSSRIKQSKKMMDGSIRIRRQHL